MNVYEKLCEVQSRLKAPKDQKNEFGKYSYRSCEDILESAKPILHEIKATLNLPIDLVQVGDRYYVKATAIFTDVESSESISSSAFARESDEKKGMDVAQITGSSTSYARKYALGGLLCIDDSNIKIEASPDPDSQDNRKEGTNSKTKKNDLIREMYEELKRTGISRSGVLKNYSVKSENELTIRQLEEINVRLYGKPDRPKVSNKENQDVNTGFQPYTPEGEDEGMRFK